MNVRYIITPKLIVLCHTLAVMLHYVMLKKMAWQL